MSSSSSDDKPPPRRVKIRKGVRQQKSSSATLSVTNMSKRRATLRAQRGEKIPENDNSASSSPNKSAKEEPKYYSRQPTVHTKSGAPFQHQEMMDHTILTKEEEVKYGRRVVQAREIREKIDALLEERRAEGEMQLLDLEEELLDDEVEGGKVSWMMRTF